MPTILLTALAKSALARGDRPTMTTTLVCTVGGTKEPIVLAIQDLKPERVVFVCSEDDPVSEKTGSWTQVERDDPSIPTRAELERDQWRVERVPTDDPDAVFARVIQVFQESATERIVADYTGGTKSMAVGLALAAGAHGNVELSLVTAPRTNLEKIGGDMARRRPTLLGEVVHRRALQLAAAAWSRYSYGESFELLDRVPPGHAVVDRSRALSCGFAKWDDYKYEEARGILGDYGRFVGEYLPVLSELCGSGDKQEIHRIYDVYLSARRRAAVGRYDLAVLLLYRTLEGIGQWSLRKHHGIDPGDVAEEHRDSLSDLLHEDHQGRWVVGMENGWRSLALLGGPLAVIAEETEGARLEFAQKRNRSILAHGTGVLTRSDYEILDALLEKRFLPEFRRQAFSREAPRQLLDALPAWS